MKKVAIFDVDGTIFRSSLLIELTDALIHEGIFGPHVGEIYSRAYRDWVERKGPYEQYIAAVIRAFESSLKGVRYHDFAVVAKKVVAFHQDQVYRYTRDLVRNLAKKKYYLLAISNSPREAVEGFCVNLGFDKVYGRIYETDQFGRLTGRVLFEELISDKAKMLARAVEREKLTLKGSLGVGDTEADIPFLKIVERPVCFNPNRKLYSHARRAGWKIVVERKDVIYEL